MTFWILLWACISSEKPSSSADQETSTQTDDTNNEVTEDTEPLVFLWDNATLNQDDVVLLPNSRQFFPATSATLTIQNDGNDSQTVTTIDLPDWLSTETQLPLQIAAQSSHDIIVQWDNSYEPGSHQGTLSVTTDANPIFSCTLEGEMEPYIQLQLQDLPQIENSIAAEVEAQNLVGAAVGIIEGQDIIFLQGFGHADQENQIMVDPFVHRFRWASLAKGLAGVVTLQQQIAGNLHIDDSIEDLYPTYQVPSWFLPSGWQDANDAQEIPEDQQLITLRMLLSHTGCIQHYSNGLVFPEPNEADRNDPSINTGMEWALASWQNEPLVCIPGTAFSYSTMGYNLAGVVLEHATGQSFEEMMYTGINAVVGAETLQPDYHWDPAPDKVTGYSRSNGVIYPETDSDVSWKLAAGGVLSTPEDLARFCAGLLGDVMLDTEMRDNELWHVQPQADDYGLGFYVLSPVIAHTGSQQSTKTALYIDQQQNRCIIAMTNSTWADPSGLIFAAD